MKAFISSPWATNKDRIFDNVVEVNRTHHILSIAPVTAISTKDPVTDKQRVYFVDERINTLKIEDV